jgi:DNA polymerase III alpha subunit (gram-positive type)
MASFMEWVGNSPLVAHNATFDMRMLLQDLEALKLEHLLNDKPV